MKAKIKRHLLLNLAMGEFAAACVFVFLYTSIAASLLCTRIYKLFSFPINLR
jgi:hypothetical protein